MQCFIPGLRHLHGDVTGLADRAFTVTGRFPTTQWLSLDSGWAMAKP